MKRLICALVAITLSSPALAGPEQFHPGTAIPDFGQIASIEGAIEIPADTVFKVSFDVAKAAEPGAVNRSFDSLARFINMHVEAGIAAEQIQLALVVHGGASADLTVREDNTSAALIATLIEHGVTIQLCGQSAAYYDITTDDLLPGVEMALSAMTAHALLQQNGYTLNPF